MSTECESSYLTDILDPKRLKKIVKVLVKVLVKVIKNKIGVDNFDAIAYRGMSGAGVANTLGYLLNKPLVMVRKKNEDCHSDMKVEGAIYAERIIVVDDCISSGNTILKTVGEIYRNTARINVKPLKVVAVVLYNDTCNYYNLLTGETVYSDRFKTIFSYSNRNEAYNQDTLKAMEDMKVYNFDLYMKNGKMKLESGTNLEVDDLK